MKNENLNFPAQEQSSEELNYGPVLTSITTLYAAAFIVGISFHISSYVLNCLILLFGSISYFTIYEYKNQRLNKILGNKLIFRISSIIVIGISLSLLLGESTIKVTTNNHLEVILIPSKKMIVPLLIYFIFSIFITIAYRYNKKTTTLH